MTTGTLKHPVVNAITRILTGRDHNAILTSRWDAMSVAYEEQLRVDAANHEILDAIHRWEEDASMQRQAKEIQWADEEEEALARLDALWSVLDPDKWNDLLNDNA